MSTDRSTGARGTRHTPRRKRCGACVPRVPPHALSVTSSGECKEFSLLNCLSGENGEVFPPFWSIVSIEFY